MRRIRHFFLFMSLSHFSNFLSLGMSIARSFFVPDSALSRDFLTFRICLSMVTSLCDAHARAWHDGAVEPGGVLCHPCAL